MIQSEYGTQKRIQICMLNFYFRHIQESIRKKQKGFYRVMKKYYEGTATDPDLLTWDAKQQIKYFLFHDCIYIYRLFKVVHS